MSDKVLNEIATSFPRLTSLSRKLQNETMKYNEAEMLIGCIGYKIKFEKVNMI